MKPIPRRDLMTSLGVLGGSVLATGCSHQDLMGAATPSQDAKAQNAKARDTDSRDPADQPQNWDYVELDPAVVADRAYQLYPEGSCMYAVVGSIIHSLADKVDGPFRSFPLEMMRYGAGGIGRWGSVCGIVNGGAAMIGLFQCEKEKARREQLISELCSWYETTPLPQYHPAKPEWEEEVASSVPGSILCHVAVSNWCQATEQSASGLEKKERCRRAAADGASKVVDILNRNLAGECQAVPLLPEVQTCLDCHGKKVATVKMNCASCHQFDDGHP